MATKIRQKPKVTKQGPKVTAKKVGGGGKGATHVHGLSRQQHKTSGPAKPRGRQTTSSTNKMPAIVEYPGEGKGKGFGPGVKIVGNHG